MITVDPILETCKGPEVTKSETWHIQRLEDGWNLVLHYKLPYCKGEVTRHIVMVQDPTVSLLFCPFLLNGTPQTLRTSV